VRTVLSIVVATLCVACAKQQPAVQQLSPQRQARCAAITDSVFANVPPEKLPGMLPSQSRPKAPLRIPRSVPVGQPVSVLFLVKPDGSGDTTLVTITGTDEARFRRDAIDYVSRNRFRPAEVEGCPIWSRGDITITKLGITREKR
jgi:hypothetical protein